MDNFPPVVFVFERRREDASALNFLFVMVCREDVAPCRYRHPLTSSDANVFMLKVENVQRLQFRPKVVVPIGRPRTVHSALLEDVYSLAGGPERIEHGHVGFSDGLGLAFQDGFNFCSAMYVLAVDENGRAIRGFVGVVRRPAAGRDDQQREKDG